MEYMGDTNHYVLVPKSLPVPGGFVDSDSDSDSFVSASGSWPPYCLEQSPQRAARSSVTAAPSLESRDAYSAQDRFRRREPRPLVPTTAPTVPAPEAANGSDQPTYPVLTELLSRASIASGPTAELWPDTSSDSGTILASPSRHPASRGGQRWLSESSASTTILASSSRSLTAADDDSWVPGSPTSTLLAEAENFSSQPQTISQDHYSIEEEEISRLQEAFNENDEEDTSATPVSQSPDWEQIPVPEADTRWEDGLPWGADFSQTNAHGIPNVSSGDSTDDSDLESIDSEMEAEMAKLTIQANLSNTFTYPRSGSERDKSDFTIPYHVQYELTRIVILYGIPLSAADEVVSDILGAKTELAKSLAMESIAHNVRASLRRFAEELRNPNELQSLFLPELFTDRISDVINEEKGWSDFLEIRGEAEYSLQGLSVTLLPLKNQKKGSRFVNRFGSDRFIWITLPSTDRKHLVEPWASKSGEELESHIAKWLESSRLQVLNRTWRCLYVRGVFGKKDRLAAIFFAESGQGLGVQEVATDEKLGFRGKNHRRKLRTEMSREDLLEWHISFDANIDKQAAKVWSRIALGLSSTLPTVTFKPSQVITVDDIVSPTGEVMNDGCCTCSPAVMHIVREKFGLEQTPTAVQARLGGAKGLWTIDPHADWNSEDIWIKVNKSQTKYNPHMEDLEGSSPDWARWTLDVLMCSKPLEAQRINHQFVRVMELQKVPFAPFKELLVEQLEQDFQDLWSSLEDPLALRSWLWNRDIGSRRTSYAGVIGMEGGIPINRDEEVHMLLEAGFLPKECRFLMAKLWNIVKDYYEDVAVKCHVTVPKSTTLFCIADPTGSLEEGEVSLYFSQGFVDPQKHRRLEYLEGDVLVARNPALLPSDVQKVRAVDAKDRRLRELKDVIVFSVKGNKPLASLLSGGDYDGDKVWVCWDPRLVEPFQNSRANFGRELSTERYFTKASERLQDLGDTRKLQFEKFFRQGFQSSLARSLLGFCTISFEKRVYNRLPNPEKASVDGHAVFLAKLCGVLVDASKQGLTPLEETRAHIRALDSESKAQPAYKDPKKRWPEGSQERWCILDRLVFEVAQSTINLQKTQFSNLCQDSKHTDADLTKTFRKERSRAEKLKHLHPLHRVLDQLRGDLHQLKTVHWNSEFDRFHHKEFMNRDEYGDYESNQLFSPEYKRVLGEVRARYRAIRPPEDALKDPEVAHWNDTADEPFSTWSLLKASTAFYNWKMSTLPWHVAMPELCFMKATAEADARPRVITERMYSTLKPGKLLRPDESDSEPDEPFL